ncbi:carotenoid oxygenase family protein [Solimonas sp. K1W22B-7]|uniref:carotenoid oxygenase family protein n=1 Tax=Solimonas sp. K1W22B-7 TaxID=2303331 RepID=UPI0013C492D4|nr:carotenoid oxygenase family protein [Solimonas sp. K1W22B-7]
MINPPRRQDSDGSGGPPETAADWHRIFEPMLKEQDYEVDEIEGRLPPDLIGTLYRNGPGQWETGTGRAPLQHVFDGDGMLSEYTLTGRRLRYRNRYVRTPQYLAGLKNRGITLRGGGTQRPGGPLANAFRFPANAANTNVVLHPERLLMLWEAGRPYELDPDTLKTLGEHDFQGELPWPRTFSAHPKFDPESGELFNFGMELLPWPSIRCYRIDPWGQLTQFHRLRIPRLVFNHDFGLTPRHMVFVLDPIVPDLPRIALGLNSIDRLMHFRRELGTRFILVPRDGGRVRQVEHEALMHFHINNAWEEGPDTVVELLRWDEDWDQLNGTLREFRTTESRTVGGRLWRYRIGADGRVSGAPCCEHVGELPQHDRRRTGTVTDFSYYAAKLANGRAAVVKVDHGLLKSQTHELPPDHVVGEPIFVPRHTRAAEDDGWLLAVAYDPAKHRSRLMILDAREPSRAPLAQAQLRHHVPQDLHGMFTSRITRSLPGE